MAAAVAEGIREKGAEAALFTAAEFDASMVDNFDAIAFGCPSMGAEQLEESEFEPMFSACLRLGRRRVDAQLGGDLRRRRRRARLRKRDLQRRAG